MLSIQKTYKNSWPTLFMVGTPIGNLSDISHRAIEVLKKVDIIYCEDTRDSQKLLKSLKITKPLKALHKFNEHEKLEEIKNDLILQKNIAIISDAGVPGISDPGTQIINALKIDETLNFNVTAVNVGPAYIHAAIMSSFNFYENIFLGFLDKKSKAQESKIVDLITFLNDKNYKAVITIYESVHRIISTINFLNQILNGDTKIAVVREITKLNEEVILGTIDEVSNYMNSNDFICKGEFVIVIDKNASLSSITSKETDFRGEIIKLVEQGISKKEAIKSVSKKYKLNKTDLYNDFHKK
ncbi:16S rRNA (cytidine(1402)-2'-O)-methyltransferase [Spiroplasma apis]|uniref:Methyltransferase n=1 Tax=Spiroplasma apis B31 TaxID=1276258 RepID=V5RJY1_SPIAP|nr:16S rRNA (cytidine(1402)-2'-O)-methyltransferase [Spiroplasma apis]AHB36095.1 methyltransferase [Spiroplasma apis B31]